MYICINCGSQSSDRNGLCQSCQASLSDSILIDGADFDTWEDAAYKEDAKAMLCVACCYQAGIGTEQDVYSAAYWLEKAAELGNRPALYQLSLMYRDGIGKEMDRSKARELMDRYEEGRQMLRTGETPVSDGQAETTDSDWFCGTFFDLALSSGQSTTPEDKTAFHEEAEDDFDEEFDEDSEEDEEENEVENEHYKQGEALYDEAWDQESEELMRQAAACYLQAGNFKEANNRTAIIHQSTATGMSKIEIAYLSACVYYIHTHQNQDQWDKNELKGYFVAYMNCVAPGFSHTDAVWRLLEQYMTN